MSSAELVSRLKQGLARRIDSLGLFQPRDASLAPQDSMASGKFFFEAGEIPRRIQLIVQNVPDFRSNVLDQAEQVLNHQFPLLGYGPIDYGEEIDWQLDAVSGKRAPLRPWPEIDYLDFDKVGDSKVTWELSRHQFLVMLAKAWLLTGEKRFLGCLARLYYDWHKKNPYPLGINWASSLEAAFRSLSWIWVHQLLAGCEPAGQLRHDITRALAFNAWYIRRYLSTYFSPNTHLQGEAVALLFIGTLFPSLPGAPDWRATGRKILLEHALSKVLEDGAYFEQSTYYHVYATDFFLHARILAERNGMPFPSDYDRVLMKMLGHLSYLCQAGPPPRLGDDDGGRVFDPRRNREEHLRDPLAIGTALFRLPALKMPGVVATEEMLWLLGEKGLEEFSAHPEWKDAGSIALPQTGLYISHCGDALRSQVILDAGPLGAGSGGHSHADLLSLTLNLGGKPLLTDPGTGVYVGAGQEREYFRNSEAHNTITVDGLSQAEPRTPFSWNSRPKALVEAIALTPEFDFIAASHDGYARIREPVTHRRTLVACRGALWFVLDDLISDGHHDYAIHWHFAPGSKITRLSEERYVAEREGSRLSLLMASSGWSHAIGSYRFSPAYGAKQAAPVLKLTRKAQGSESVAAILCAEATTDPFHRLAALSHSCGIRAFRLTGATTQSIFVFGDNASPFTIDGWESDARFLYAEFDGANQPLRLFSVNIGFVRYQGGTLHESSRRAPHFMWRRENAT